MEMLAPNQEYLEMNYVAETATGKGNNTQFIMENLHDGTFRVIDGRVGIKVGPNKPKKYTLPIERWDSIYLMKINHGFLVTKKEKMDKKVVQKNDFQYMPIEDPDVEDIVKALMSYADEVIAESYSVTLDDISEEMIELGKKVLEELSLNYDKMSVAEFNNKLKVLYTAIPRRIDNLSKNLSQRKIQFVDIIAREQELFDLMLAQLRTNSAVGNNKTILDAHGLEWRTVNADEEAEIKKAMGANASQYLNAWRIENRQTRKRFDEFCSKENLSFEDNTIHKLFHGSRSENFWSIITNGLTINPTGVVITGKMFGNGSYFASKAKKSMGYTSSHNAYWTNGSCNTGFLAMYDVATGKHYDLQYAESDLTYSKLQQRCPGAHCTWAHAGQALLNDEIIVYQDCQSSIRYLIEFKA